MPLAPGLASARRLLTLVGLALIALTLVGALAFSFQATGNNCGSGWAAARKPLPSPLLTEEDKKVIARDRLQPYEFGVAKARPIETCRRAGAKRLITAGVGALLILIPVGALLAFLNWPRRDEMVDVSDAPGDPDGPAPVSNRGSDWAGR